LPNGSKNNPDIKPDKQLETSKIEFITMHLKSNISDDVVELKKLGVVGASGSNPVLGTQIKKEIYGCISLFLF
jgi:hypothetical protein